MKTSKRKDKENKGSKGSWEESEISVHNTCLKALGVCPREATTLLLSLPARSRNCYKSYNSQIKNKPTQGKAQLSLLMRPKRRFSHVSSYTLKSTRINWIWNHRLF